METHHSNARISIYGMRDVPVIKGDASLYKE
jgi:hypothetical protein